MIDMKKLFSLFVVAALFVVSCGKNEPVEKNSANKVLQGTKWTVKSWDYSLGDDWAGIHKYTTVFYFHSISEGVVRLMNEDFYTDMGSSVTEKIEHFKYTVDGNKVYLEYVTDGFMNLMRLDFDGSNIYVETTRFVKSAVSDSDYQWLSSICGKTGSCSWYSNANGKLWIVGDGPMADYNSFSATPWAANNSIPNNVCVGEGVTKIGAYAFANPSIAEVEMPDKSLTEVGASAFNGSLISTIWLSQGTKEIGPDAFGDCKYLKHVNVPDHIVSIGQCAFSGTALNELQLAFPSSLEVIQAYAFEGGKASYLIFEEGVRSIMTGAFLGDYCGIDRELILPNSLMNIGSTVFEGVYNKVVIGTNTSEIGDKAFITGAATGDMFVNRTTPPNAGEDIIVERTNWRSAESGWTLHVPSGSKSVYSETAPWNKFKAIIEDGSLDGEGDDSGDGGSGNDDIVEYSDLRQDELDASDSRRGPVATGFSKGTGTYSDPYIIESAAELRYFSDAVRGGNVFKNEYVKLGADITINLNVLNSLGELNGDGSNFEPWIPIGRYEPSYFFCGTFDGDGHTISGLYCNRPEGQNIGLFGKLFGNVRDVVIKDSYFAGAEYVGAVAGNTRANYNGSTIPSSLGDYYHKERSITVKSCVNESVLVGGKYVGGIIGQAYHVHLISACLNAGVVSGESGVGGIIGYTTNDEAEIRDCINTGTIVGGESAMNVGGIFGYSTLGTNIYNCLNKGSVKGGGSQIGGISGSTGKPNSCTMTNCLNLSQDIVGPMRVGAIIGANFGITAKYNYYLFVDGFKGVGETIDPGKSSYNSSMTESELKSADFLNKLNSKVKSGWSKWKTGADGFPILEWID